ncbi:hypothetical protein LTR56_004912 [Elasticomyces elasticus]|nr:hypothetical protein LTR56_004912 [Elasticomyces elasticus]KAK3664686.1 hypothetical protein LTR22_004554 [Elasticomyces elasticus]KAK4913725.1 hypothetical protein LTR49_017982 [Elasticomyces elasticus]KAK5747736.1 hypothetical protein LTS12_022233 [Elasticomyces elasticus]
MLRCGKQIRWEHAVQRSRIPGVRHALPIGPLTKVERVAIRYYATAKTRQYRHRGEPFEDFPVFKRVAPPTRDKDWAATWAPLLEACLPASLRRSRLDDPGAVSIDSPSERGDVLLAARRGPTSLFGVDLLHDLAVTQGRWKAAVWLIKDIIDHFGPIGQQARSQLSNQGPWPNKVSLDDITEEPIDLLHPGPVLPQGLSRIAMLETMEQPADTLTHSPESKRRNVLGVVWRTLGAMILSCGKGPVKPEILEIIAHLHHQDLLPKDIYNRIPRSDETAIQQPPILHLLSSRILTSLSDAAWRAHERTVIEEASATGSKYVALRPEIPGSAYRTRVAGIRPEVWLELVLWACLHGEWVLEGVAILRSVCKQTKPEWRPISWRTLYPMAPERPEDWDKLDYIFNTRSPATMDQDPVVHDVKRTVSSEVVNAYVDAILGEVNAGSPGRAITHGGAVTELVTLQRFLEKSGLKLGGGSWDAVVLRMVDSLGPAATRIGFVQDLIKLSPGFGGEVRSPSSRSLPPYVLEGSAAIIGVAHQAMRASIEAGHLEQALRLLRMLQIYTDENKLGSLSEFFAAPQRRDHSDQRGLFTSNFETIEYPAFELQLPPTILGPLLDLVTDNQAFDIGRWLLYNDEIDGPLIVESSYNDPVIAPALVKFAIATSDKLLLSKLVRRGARNDSDVVDGPEVPQNVLQAVLNAQIQLRQWTAARLILQTLLETTGPEWTIVNLAVLARTMILVGKAQGSRDEECAKDLAEAKSIFAAMVKGEYSKPGRIERVDLQDQLRTLLTVVSVVGLPWASFCQSVGQIDGFFYYNLPTTTFNQVLQGVLEAYGIGAARRLIMLFWPREVRLAQVRQLVESNERSQLLGPKGHSVDLTKRHRTKIDLLKNGTASVVMYGGLRPNTTTIRMIFRKALDQLRPKTVSATPTELAITSESTCLAERTIRWCIQRLRNLDMAEADIRDEFEEALPEQWRERALPFDAGEEALSKRAEGEEGTTEADEAEADETDDDIDDGGNNNVAEEKREAT